MIADLWQDLRFGARMLAKQPGYTLIAVLTLALGIGANTAIFSVINGVLWRALPFDEPARLVMLYEKKEGNSYDTVSYPDFLDFKAQSHSFARLAALSPVWTLNWAGTAGAQQLTGYFASGELFATLGAQAWRGRLFDAAEDQPNSERAVVLSYAAWQSRFGGNPNVIGERITLDAQGYTIIGVLPAGFRVLQEVDVYLPLAFNPLINRGRQVRFLSVLGRLQAHTDVAAAQAESAGLMASLARQYPDSNYGFRAEVAPLHEHITGKVRPILWLLLGAVAFVLLIACANVAGLSLARALSRRGELAVRAALGASRFTLVRQLLVESLQLALLGGGVGWMLARWGLDALIAFSPGDLPRLDEIRLDRVVLGFTVGLSCLTGLAFGLAPAWQLTREDLNAALKEGGRGAGAGARARRMRNALVVAEIALSLVLLVGAGLLWRSFQRVLAVEPGFATENLLTFSVSLTAAHYSEAQRRAEFYRQLEERLAALPGVRAVGATTRLPLLTVTNNITSLISIEGQPATVRDPVEVDFRRATPGYFAAMGIPLTRGRLFNQTDLQGRTLGVIVNETLARRHWPGEDPVGKRVQFAGGANAIWSTVIGVVGDVRHLGLDVTPRAEIYLHYLTSPPTGGIIALRTAGAPETIQAALSGVIHALDPAVPLSQVNPMKQLVTRSVAPRRFNLMLFGGFAAVALALALIGLYGVIAYTAAQRTREFGLRMALGAQPRDVARLVITQGLKLTACGLSLGLPAAWLLTRWLRGMLFEVKATDPLTFAFVAALLTLVALCACWLPARRATKVSPLVALRSE